MIRAALVLIAAAVPAATLAQPVDLPIPPATTDVFPPGVKVRNVGGRNVYVDGKGRTLYGMDMRTLMRFGADPSQHCAADCRKEWVPLTAPADAQVNIRFPQGLGDRQAAADTRFVQNQRAPDWTVIEGPAGKQWVYKGWHMVFTHAGERAGLAAHDGAGGMVWNTLKYVPPVPQVTAPGGVAPVQRDGGWVLADKDGRVLFTGACKTDCADWKPLTGGMASRALGEWTVATDEDRPQWRWKGKPVWVNAGVDPLSVPAGGKELRP